MRNDIYFLYSDPVEGMRTGHAALALVRGGEIVCYFSMYHTRLPDEVRKMSLWQRFTCAIPAYFVTSYEKDVVQRGQSITRFQNNEKENITVPDILKTLEQLDEKTKREYFKLGQFHHAIRLPDDLFDFYRVRLELDYLRWPQSSTAWTLCAPFTTIFFNYKAHNCCSAITHALQRSTNERKPESPPVLMKVLYFAYFAILYALRDSMIERSLLTLLYLPALYPLFHLLQTMNNARIYVQDLAKMAKQGGPDIVTFTMVYLFCTIVNILGSPFSDNRCLELFSFPGALARSLKSIPGVQEIKPPPRLFTMFPERKRIEQESTPEQAERALLRTST